MKQILRKFIYDDAGAVTVDWVVLTAAIVGLGTIVIFSIGEGAMDTSTGLGAHVGSTQIRQW